LHRRQASQHRSDARVIEDLSNTQFIDAQTVGDGIAVARALKPDVIITDIHLPDGKGFDVLRALREDAETAHIPIIALTADAMPINMDNWNGSDSTSS
jgi:CheY-like chemotaxis protein